MREIFKIHVRIKDSEELRSGDRIVRMIQNDEDGLVIRIMQME